MAKLGVRTVDEMVGRTDLLKKKDGLARKKSDDRSEQNPVRIR